jgi:hypothetical protein
MNELRSDKTGAIGNTIREHREKGTLKTFLQKLRTFHQNLTEGAAEALMLKIAIEAPVLSRTSESLWDSEFDHAVWLIMELANDCLSDNLVEPVLDKIIDQTQREGMALTSLLVQSCDPKRGGATSLAYTAQ